MYPVSEWEERLGKHMETKQVILTIDGLHRLEEELDDLKSRGRRDVAEKIKQARAFGDLSENSEYDEAKNEQAQMEMRIVQLENMLKNAKVIDENDLATDVVSVGTKVLVYDCDFEEEVEYAIVGSAESDPAHNKISDEAPIGKALIGAKVDETVKVLTPSGDEIELKVLKISR